MIKFADRMDHLTGSAIRELLKLTARPEVISFAGGMPAKEYFPRKEMEDAAIKVLTETGEIAMQYSSTEGYPKLREQIVDRMKKKQHIDTDIDHILITPGSQLGLDMSARVFLNKDDIVLLESPSYVGGVNAFKTCEPRFIDIPTDDDGMLIDHLEKAMAEHSEEIKLVYVIPDFQNPSGKQWSLERRKQFMEVINKYEIPVIEDNPYGELVFEGEMLPSLKSLDTKGLVVYLGTFSKILAPGYRLGWVCANDEILDCYNRIAQASYLQPSTIAQMETAQFIEDNDLDAHVATIIEVYRKRRDAMFKVLEENLPEGCKFTHSKGGLFTWVELPDSIDTDDLQMKFLERNVACVPGSGFFPNGGNRHCMRLNYSCMPEDKITEGVKVMCECIADELK